MNELMTDARSMINAYKKRGYKLEAESDISCCYLMTRRSRRNPKIYVSFEGISSVPADALSWRVSPYRRGSGRANELKDIGELRQIWRWIGQCRHGSCTDWRGREENRFRAMVPP